MPTSARPGRGCLKLVCCLALMPSAAPGAGSGHSIRAMVQAEATLPWPDGRPPFGIAFSVWSRGLMVTAAHVVAGCRSIAIVEPAGPAAARLLLVDQDNDVAVLQSDAGASLPGRLADRVARAGDRLTRPEFVASEDGMPPGLAVIRVSGITSGLGRAPVLMLDGVFLPGMSGSPLLDRDGAISGMIVGRIGNVRPAGIAIAAGAIAADLRRIGLPAGQSREATGPGMGFVREVRCGPR